MSNSYIKMSPGTAGSTGNNSQGSSPGVAAAAAAVGVRKKPASLKAVALGVLAMSKSPTNSERALASP